MNRSKSVSPVIPRAGNPFLATGLLKAARFRRHLAQNLIVYVLFGSIFFCQAVDAQELSIDIKAATLEELIDISVTTVSKKEERLQEVAAAIFVLTGEEIRQSGVTSVPDALRLVPGVEVAKLEANKWAVSIRGFNSRTSNKLLVLIDGRSVYNPLFTGVLWESKDVMLEDIERIEVVRGPGGTLWGANAVNGVINILTKNARETQGALVVLGGGVEEQGFANVRYGLQLADDTYLRAYGKVFKRDTGFSTGEVHDDWSMGRFGFRLDGHSASASEWSVQGDLYRASVGERLNPSGSQDVMHWGGNLLGRWSRSFSSDSEVALQVYHDYTELDNISLGEQRHTTDFDFQHTLRILSRHEVVWGLGLRHLRDDIRNSVQLVVEPRKRNDNLFSVFAQDEIRFMNNQLNLTLGSKLERNDYTGVEIQPSARISWTPTRTRTMWASISRALRTPSRLESDLVFNGVRAGRAFGSEELIAYEVGYRFNPAPTVLVDLAGFVNVYDRLQSIESDMAGNLSFQNNMHGESYGFEWSSKWQVLPGWRLIGSYSYLEMHLSVDPGSAGGASATVMEGSHPNHKMALHSTATFASKLQLDLGLRFVDELPALNVPSYFALDVRLGWRPLKNLELALVLLNAFDGHHQEQRGQAATEVEDSIFGRIAIGF